MKLKRYFDLIDNHPGFFMSQDAPLKIIKDSSEILSWQKSERRILAQNSLPLEWAEIGLLSSDSYMIILRDLVEFPDGNMAGYVRALHRATLFGGNGVIILPIYDKSVLLINHFRHSTRKWHWEFPRGYAESGLSSAENASRELKEEIGAEAPTLTSLGTMYPETGFENQRVDLFLAQLASIPIPQINEGIESFVWLTVQELEDWIASEKITDGFTIVAYARAKLKGLI